MGTSKDYGAPKTPEWGQVKRDVSNGGKDPQLVPPPPVPPPPDLEPIPHPQPQPFQLPVDLPQHLCNPVQRMNQTLGRFIRVQYGGGGTGGTSSNAVRTAQRVGRNLGSFFSFVGSTGALNAAAELGVGNLLGMSASDIIMTLTDVLGGPATTPDDVDARNAMARLMDEQLKGLTSDEIVNALERIPTGAEFARLIERFFALYIHEQFNRIFYSRLEARVGKDKAAQYLKNGLHCIEWMLRDRVSQMDVQTIDWAGHQGEGIINGTMKTVFDIFTGGE